MEIEKFANMVINIGLENVGDFNLWLSKPISKSQLAQK